MSQTYIGLLQRLQHQLVVLELHTSLPTSLAVLQQTATMQRLQQLDVDVSEAPTAGSNTVSLPTS